MIYKNERTLWKAKRVDNGDIAIGYYEYHKSPEHSDKIHILNCYAEKYDSSCYYEIYPATLEPVAVRPNYVEVIGFNIPKCPNCEIGMAEKYAFCPECGQCLDWSA